MRGFCLASSPNEITGIGTIKLYHGHFLVDQIFVPQQKVCPGYCESDHGAINEIIFNVVEDNPARAGELRFRWHSHAKSSVFWSTTDEKDIDTWQGPWAVNLVMNVHDDYLARLDLYDPLRVRNVPLELKIIIPIPDDTMMQCQQEITTKVKTIHSPLKKPILTDHHDDIVLAILEAKYGATKGGEAYETK